jgi:hypothetical protein
VVVGLSVLWREIFIQVYFFVRLYRFKCFDRVSAVLARKFSTSRPCSQRKNLCCKLASFVVILVKNDMNAHNAEY